MFENIYLFEDSRGGYQQNKTQKRFSGKRPPTACPTKEFFTFLKILFVSD